MSYVERSEKCVVLAWSLRTKDKSKVILYRDPKKLLSVFGCNSPRRFPPGQLTGGGGGGGIIYKRHEGWNRVNQEEV